MSETGPVVALDVGGTAMKGAVVDRSGALLHTETRSTDRERGVDAVLDALAAFAADLAATAGGAVAAGVVVPGLIDEVSGTAVYSANIGWRDLPLRALLHDRISLPVALGHDVRAGAVAEGLLGAARGARHFLFLPIGTGIAGGIVLEGQPYAGARAFGGEIGHVPVVPDGEPCACGQRGCLETYASAAAVCRRYLAAGGGPVTGAQEVIARAEGGDPVAGSVWDEAIGLLSSALATYVQTMDPELVVVGGGLAAAGDLLFGPLRTGLAERLAFRTPPPLVPAMLGDRAGCLGAGVLAWRAVGLDLVPGQRQAR